MDSTHTESPARACRVGLQIAGWAVLLCGLAHSFGHFKGIANPQEDELKAIVARMSSLAVPGPLLDPSLFGLLKGFSLFLSINSIFVGLAIVLIARRARERATLASASLLVLVYCVTALVASALYFIVPPTLLFAAATLAAIFAYARR